MHLAAVHTPAARAGDDAPITLYWTVQAQTPQWIVFLHLVDATGVLVAQWDEPVGNPYRPPERRENGQLLRQVVPLPLPSGLAPGEYTVLAGIYPADDPADPLLPVGAASPRIPVATLQVTQ